MPEHLTLPERKIIAILKRNGLNYAMELLSAAVNLEEVMRENDRYSITQAGLDYLDGKEEAKA